MKKITIVTILLAVAVLLTAATDSFDIFDISRANITIVTEKGIASGVAVTENLILTSYHVLSEDLSIKTNYTIGNKNAWIVKVNKEKDLALIETDIKLMPVKLSKVDVKGFDDIVIISNPNGIQNTITKGIVSRSYVNDKHMTDATVDHGSSGGMVLLDGKLVGIVNSTIGKFGLFTKLYDINLFLKGVIE